MVKWKKIPEFPFRYSGEYFAKSSNTYYLRARYYNPAIGRFITEDSIRGKATDPLSLNLYIYCANNPIIFWDPSGHMSVLEIEQLNQYDKRETPELAEYENIFIDSLLADDEFAYMDAYILLLDLYANQGAISEEGLNHFGLDTFTAESIEIAFHTNVILKSNLDWTNYGVWAEQTAYAFQGLALFMMYGNPLEGYYGNEVVSVNSINTPYGEAIQSNNPKALDARSQYLNGGTVYRGGELGRSQTGNAQFWGLENPMNAGYADKYGVDFNRLDYIMMGTLPAGSNFITRPAPGLGGNLGGGIEIIVDPGTININSFYMR